MASGESSKVITLLAVPPRHTRAAQLLLSICLADSPVYGALARTSVFRAREKERERPRVMPEFNFAVLSFASIFNAV